MERERKEADCDKVKPFWFFIFFVQCPRLNFCMSQTYTQCTLHSQSSIHPSINIRSSVWWKSIDVVCVCVVVGCNRRRLAIFEKWIVNIGQHWEGRRQAKCFCAKHHAWPPPLMSAKRNFIAFWVVLLLLLLRHSDVRGGVHCTRCAHLVSKAKQCVRPCCDDVNGWQSYATVPTGFWASLCLTFDFSHFFSFHAMWVCPTLPYYYHFDSHRLQIEMATPFGLGAW